jgi:hypothetical protein
MLLFFSDYFLPLSRLIVPNPYGKFRLEKRNVMFNCTLILKEGISDGILEVFVLC